MIKGCQKKMVLVKCAGSELFEEAYFILKSTPATQKTGGNDMTEEAGRIISRSLNGAPPYDTEASSSRRRTLIPLLCYAAGLISGGGIGALIFLFCR